MNKNHRNSHAEFAGAVLIFLLEAADECIRILGRWLVIAIVLLVVFSIGAAL
jgi:hypothetical protein